MALREYNMCKKCSYGCCKELAKDNIKELWRKICDYKREDVKMFGDSAVILLSDLEHIFENILKEY